MLRRMPRLLIVHHTISPATQACLEAVLEGATDDAIEGVEVVTKAALAAGAADALAADGFLLGTPANIGYMSGALKHFFDLIYYPCLEETVRAPFGVYIHGNSDTAGALRGITTITTGLKWRAIGEPVTIVGEPSAEDLEACWNLGATVAAELSPSF
jgi:multimeric flavodoxin WrbA